MNSETAIIVSLFDRHTLSREEGGDTVLKYENRFLGNFTIPLHTILTNPNKTELNLKLNRPLALTSYKVAAED